jgi:hypothetical protein
LKPNPIVNGARVCVVEERRKVLVDDYASRRCVVRCRDPPISVAQVACRRPRRRQADADRRPLVTVERARGSPDDQKLPPDADQGGRIDSSDGGVVGRDRGVQRDAGLRGEPMRRAWCRRLRRRRAERAGYAASWSVAQISAPADADDYCTRRGPIGKRARRWERGAANAVAPPLMLTGAAASIPRP